METRSIRLLIYVHMPNIYQQFLNINLFPLNYLVSLKICMRYSIEHNFDLSY
jgi:hypothetical protein